MKKVGRGEWPVTSIDPSPAFPYRLSGHRQAPVGNEDGCGRATESVQKGKTCQAELVSFQTPELPFQPS